MMKLPANRYTALAVLWFFAGIYFLLLRDGGGAPPFRHFDKVAHFGLFFAQIWLCAKAFMAANETVPYKTLFVFAVLCAAGSEAAQAVFMATREGSWGDVLADIAGAAAALCLARKVEQAKLLQS